jgi:hypothetical protein
VGSISFDLNSGRTFIKYKPDEAADNAALWQAIKDAGFTPTKIETKGGTYDGP